MSKEVTISASSLVMPSISGTVSVPLAELDRLRSEHVNAVNVARDLESRQQQVRIVVYERREERSYDYNRNLRIRDKEVEYSRNYIALDSVREVIRLEEEQKQVDIIANKTKQIQGLQNEIDSLTKKGLEKSETILLLEKERLELIDDKDALNQFLKTTQDNLQRVSDWNLALEKTIIKLKDNRGFWARIFD